MDGDGAADTPSSRDAVLGTEAIPLPEVDGEIVSVALGETIAADAAVGAAAADALGADADGASMSLGDGTNASEALGAGVGEPSSSAYTGKNISAIDRKMILNEICGAEESSIAVG